MRVLQYPNRAFLVIAFGLMSAGCAHVHASSSSIGTAVSPLKLEDLLNGTYYKSEDSDRVAPLWETSAYGLRLTDGVYLGSFTRLGLVSVSCRVSLQRQWIAWGDLDGDGVNDAALVLKRETSGAPYAYYDLVAVINDHGQANAYVPEVLGGGPGFQINSVTIFSGRVVVDLWHPDESEVAPGLVRRFRKTYWLGRTGLTLQEETRVQRR